MPRLAQTQGSGLSFDQCALQGHAKTCARDNKINEREWEEGPKIIHVDIPARVSLAIAWRRDSQLRAVPSKRGVKRRGWGGGG